MNKTDSPNNNDFDNWKSWPPDAVLHAFVSELKGPLTSIKGYAQILSLDSSEELRVKATTNIVKTVERFEDLMKDVISYLNEYQAKDEK